MAARGVVGVDGSASSLAAVEAAAREARWRGAGQHLVHAFIWPTMHVPLGPSELGPPDGGLRNMARRLVAEAEEHARTVAPDVTVTSARRDRGRADGPRSAVPHGAAHGDRLPEHGRRHRPAGGLDRGTPGRPRPLPHPGGPGPGDAAGPIVLGVDGSAAGERAIEFAFAEAVLRNADLLAYTPWNTQTPPPPDPALPYASAPGAPAERETSLLSAALAGHQEKHPDVHVECHAVRQDTREALIKASRTAQLLVVGARGRGGFTGLLLGSVSQAMLNHAHCPVAVAPTASTTR
ncbi:hypothetical protein GCM10010282_31990 [Streptomyces roseolus]|nr:hypothetical protein GCM10010282_31990 [Streptomyces roseolus]